MYPLSKNVDLSFLVGAELLQICVGRNELILNFHQDIRITILSEVLVGTPGGAPQSYETPAGAAVVLFPLLHEVVAGARATNGGGLLLTFASGTTLEAPDTSDQFESLWIAHGDRMIIV